MKFVEVFLR